VVGLLRERDESREVEVLDRIARLRAWPRNGHRCLSAERHHKLKTQKKRDREKKICDAGASSAM
jgi:hypothetical protein